MDSDILLIKIQKSEGNSTALKNWKENLLH